MKYNSKYLLGVIILAVLLILSLVLYESRINKDVSDDNSETISNTVTENTSSKTDFLLDDFPLDEVPLYKVTEVSSSKLFNNWDARNISTFDDIQFSYHNVVFYTDAPQVEFLDYYKEIFDQEIVDEYPIPDMVKGNIGKYRVTAAHYDSDNTAYVQVYFPNEEFNKENKYFDTYPNLFEEDPMFIEEENSFGLLNQVGGQTEYTKYYTVLDSGDANNDGIDDVDEFGVLIAKYQDKYKLKDNYEYNTENNLLSWEEDGYKVKASFSRDHGRIYLNIRGSIQK